MNDQTEEILTILQEESAEVIVEVSKCFRFGYTPQNVERLQKEIGDLSLMIELLVKENIGVTNDGIEQAKQAKMEKLKIFSSIKF